VQPPLAQAQLALLLLHPLALARPMLLLLLFLPLLLLPQLLLRRLLLWQLLWVILLQRRASCPLAVPPMLQTAWIHHPRHQQAARGLRRHLWTRHEQRSAAPACFAAG
jgi:hypothetical protein